jgi:hypothetical protein
MIDSSPDRSVAGGCPEFTEEFKKVLAAHGSKNKFRAISYETFPFGRRGPQDVPLDHEDRVLARARQLQIVSPGLASWDILSRPLRGLFLALKSTQDWRPGLLSAVPSGLDLESVVLTQTR